MFSSSKKVIDIKLPYLLFVILFFFIPIIVAGNSSIFLGALLATTVSVCYMGGATILSYMKFPDSLSDMSRAFLNTLVGALFFSPLLFVPVVNNYLLLTCITLLLAYWLFTRNIKVSSVFNMYSMFLGIVAIGIMFLTTLGEDMSRFLYAEQRVPDEFVTDRFFFTSVVWSIKEGSIYSAAYETGTPLNYHVLGMFIPAFLAKTLHITSHQALWGLAMSFYRVLVCLLEFEFISIFIADRRIFRSKYLYALLVMLLPVILAPLHPLYILKGEFSLFVFQGTGYLLPGGNIPTSFGMVLFLLSMMVFAIIKWGEAGYVADKVLFTFVFALLFVSKIPLFAINTLAISTLVLIRVFIRKEDKLTSYLWYGIFGFAGAFLLMKIFFVSGESPSKVTIRFGYLIERMGELFKISPSTTGGTVSIIAFTIGLYLFWLNLRLVGITNIFLAKDHRVNEWSFSTIITFFFALLPSLILRMEMVDIFGGVSRDFTSDTEQFIRAAFYFMTLVSAIGIARIITQVKVKPGFRYAMLSLIMCWGLLVGVFLGSKIKSYAIVSMPWYEEVKKDLQAGKMDDGLISFNPFSTMGILLSSSDHGRYWTSVAQGKGLYNSSMRNAYRWRMYKEFIDNPSAMLLQRFREEGVKYIVAGPSDIARLTEIAGSYPQHLSLLTGSKWVYIVN